LADLGELFRRELPRSGALDLGDSRRAMLSLGVGDVVVYGVHGAGRVEARETRSVHGEQQTVVVIALAAGLSVQLPLTRAQEQLRPIVDEEAIASIQQVLRAPPPPISKDSWVKRRRDAEAKLRDAIGLAEVIRDGNARETVPARGTGSHLSPGERELVRRAKQLLTNEIALARGVAAEEAGGWLEAQLAC
jgi:CarD family transcriptional regulator